MGRSPFVVCAQVNSRREVRSEPCLGPLGPLESLPPRATVARSVDNFMHSAEVKYKVKKPVSLSEANRENLALARAYAVEKQGGWNS